MLLIDSREARAHPDILASLRRLTNDQVDWEQTFDFGDYLFTGEYPHPTLNRPPTVAIELCTVPDLLGKITSGRFSYQLSGMIERYDVRVLLIETPIVPDRQGQIRIPGSPSTFLFNRIRDSLYAAQCHGVIVEYANGRESVPDQIVAHMKYWAKPYEEHKSFRPTQLTYDALIPLGEPLDSRVATLMTLPGIGEQRAVDAINLYHSLSLIFSLPHAALCKIPGWGATTAKKVYDYIHLNTETGEIVDD